MLDLVVIVEFSEQFCTCIEPMTRCIFDHNFDIMLDCKISELVGPFND